jgi:hypothetical protein
MLPPIRPRVLHDVDAVDAGFYCGWQPPASA